MIQKIPSSKFRDPEDPARRSIMAKPCSGCTSQPEQPGARDVRTTSLSAHTDLLELLTSSLEQEIQVDLAASDTAVGRLLATPGLLTQVHSVPEDSASGGGVVVTAATSTGSEAVIKAVGSVASTYHASTLRFFLDQETRAIRVQLSSEQPLQVDYTWHYAFRDVVALPNGHFTASSVELDALKMAAAPRVDLDQTQQCYVLCGVQGIVGVLLACLPAIIVGGPPLYIACVAAGSSAAFTAILCGLHCALSAGGSPTPPPPPGHAI
jgi:hypothetical protein